MSKTVLMVLVLLSAAGLVAFANGAGETTGGVRPWAGGSTNSGEPVTLTGTLDLQSNPYPVLKTGSEVWSLMVPGMYGYDVPVQHGDSVTVSGFEVPGPRYYRGSGERTLMVQKALIAGKEYLLPGGYGRYGMMGPNRMMGGYGMMGPYGRMGWLGGGQGYNGRGGGPYDGPGGYGAPGYAYQGGCGYGYGY